MEPRRDLDDLHDSAPLTFVCPDCGSVRAPRVVHHPAGTVLLCATCRSVHRVDAVGAATSGGLDRGAAGGLVAAG